MRITECREEDVSLLEAQIPSLGTGSQHTARFARHREGASTFLVAWREGLPVGCCEVRWSGCDAPEVRAVCPGTPEVYGLGPWSETMRSPSTGTALIRAAERLARRRGRSDIGIGMEKNNPRAEALYKSLGYRPSTPYLECWSYEDSDGVAHRVADACTFLIKRFAEPQEGARAAEHAECAEHAGRGRYVGQLTGVEPGERAGLTALADGAAMNTAGMSRHGRIAVCGVWMGRVV